MPTYEITAPDGKKYRVSGDGTAEEALAHFQSQYKAPQGGTPTPGMPVEGATGPLEGTQPGGPVPPVLASPPAQLDTLEKVRRGVAASGIKAGLGLGGLVEKGLEKSPIFTLARGLGWKGALPSPEEQERMLTEVNADVAEGGLVSRGAELGGDIAATVIPGARAYGAISKGVGAARPILSRALAATGSGALTGGAFTPGDLGERGTAAAAGAAGGLAGEAGGAVLSRALRPVTPSRAAEKLLEQGVVPTVGQGAKSSGFKMLEDIVSHVPITGQVVRRGQERALQEFREKALEDVIGKAGGGPSLVKDVMSGDREAIGIVDNFIKTTYAGKTPADKEIRNMWRTYKLASSELGSEGGVMPKALQAASRTIGGRGKFATGEAPLQDIADPAQILKKSGTGVFPTMAGLGASGMAAAFEPSLVGAITLGSTLGATRAGARLAMGDYAWQRALREALRKSGVPAVVGTAVGREIEED